MVIARYAEVTLSCRRTAVSRLEIWKKSNLLISPANLDLALMKFLKAYFPLEVKEKQKDNERNSAIDQYGGDPEKCVIM